MRSLGFVNYIYGLFQGPNPLKILNCSLVRKPNLEYRLLIWLNSTLRQTYKRKSVENNYFLFISFKFSIRRPTYKAHLIILFGILFHLTVVIYFYIENVYMHYLTPSTVQNVNSF